MIEQINIALRAKRVREFLQPGSLKPAQVGLTSEKRAYTSIKSDEYVRVLPSGKDDIINSLNYEGIAVIELQFYHFPDSDRLRVGSVTD